MVITQKINRKKYNSKVEVIKYSVLKVYFFKPKNILIVNFL